MNWKTIGYHEIDLLPGPAKLNMLVTDMVTDLFCWSKAWNGGLLTLTAPSGQVFFRFPKANQFNYNPAQDIGHAWMLVRAFHEKGIGIRVHPYSIMREGFRVSVHVGHPEECGYFCVDHAPEGIAKASLWAGQILLERLLDQ